MPKFIIGFKKGKRCEYCDKPKSQRAIDESGICPECRELIERLRKEFDPDE